MKKLPTWVYVRYETIQDGETYLLADGNGANLIEGDGPTTVGIYQLGKQIVMSKQVQIKPVGAQRRKGGR